MALNDLVYKIWWQKNVYESMSQTLTLFFNDFDSNKKSVEKQKDNCAPLQYENIWIDRE